MLARSSGFSGHRGRARGHRAVRRHARLPPGRAARGARRGGAEAAARREGGDGGLPQAFPGIQRDDRVGAGDDPGSARPDRFRRDAPLRHRRPHAPGARQLRMGAGGRGARDGGAAGAGGRLGDARAGGGHHGRGPGDRPAALRRQPSARPRSAAGIHPRRRRAVSGGRGAPGSSPRARDRPGAGRPDLARQHHRPVLRPARRGRSGRSLRRRLARAADRRRRGPWDRRSLPVEGEDPQEPREGPRSAGEVPALARENGGRRGHGGRGPDRRAGQPRADRRDPVHRAMPRRGDRPLPLGIPVSRRRRRNPGRRGAARGVREADRGVEPSPRRRADVRPRRRKGDRPGARGKPRPRVARPALLPRPPRALRGAADGPLPGVPQGGAPDPASDGRRPARAAGRAGPPGQGREAASGSPHLRRWE